MNFNSLYNTILEHYNKNSIPSEDYGNQVWFYSSCGFPEVQEEKGSVVGCTADEGEIDWIVNTWQEDNYSVDILGDTSVEFADKDAQTVREFILKYFHDMNSQLLLSELLTALKELESRVVSNPVGYYKFFGNSEHMDYWVCYVYLGPNKLERAKDATKEDTDDISNW